MLCICHKTSEAVKLASTVRKAMAGRGGGEEGERRGRGGREEGDRRRRGRKEEGTGEGEERGRGGGEEGERRKRLQRHRKKPKKRNKKGGKNYG